MTSTTTRLSLRRVDVLLFAFLATLSGAMIYATGPTVAVEAAVAGVLLILFGGVYRARPASFLIALVAIPTFESLALLLAGSAVHLPPSIVKGLLSVKFLLLGAAVLAGANSWLRSRNLKVDLAAYVMTVYAILVLIFTVEQNLASYGLVAQIRGALSYLTPVLLFCVGRFAQLRAVDANRFYRSALVISLVAALIGLFERFVLPISFWQDLHLGEFIVTKGGLPFVATNGIEGILGSSFSRRLIGPFAYPLNAGYFFIVPLLICVAALLSRQFTKLNVWLGVSACAFAVAEAFTFTRGAWIGVVVGLVYLAFAIKQARRFIPFMIAGAIALALTPIGDRLIMPTVTLADPSARQHLGDFLYDLQVAFGSAFGSGFGTAGFFGNLANGHALVGEDLFATTAAQCGIVGLALFLVFVVCLVAELVRVRGRHLSVLAHGLVASTLAFLIGSIPTEHWQAFESAGLYWLLAGVLVGSTTRTTEREICPPV